MSEAARGYNYVNTTVEGGSFRIIDTLPGHPGFMGMPGRFEGIKKAALLRGYGSIPLENQSTEITDYKPGDDLASWQAMNAAATDPHTHYVHVEVPAQSVKEIASRYIPLGGGVYLAGVGKSTVEDTRSGWQQFWRPTPPSDAQVVDLSDIFVHPRLTFSSSSVDTQNEVPPSLERRGYGSAMAYTLLERYDGELLVRVRDRGSENVRKLLEGLGFTASSGEFAGVSVGELQERLVERHSWLADGKPIAA